MGHKHMINKQFFQNLFKSGGIVTALIWNMGGLCFFYMCRWLMHIAAVRMAPDYYAAGTLALSVSITNIWNVLALFSVRSIQVSDVKGEYTDNEYVSARIVTVCTAVALCIGYAYIFVGDTYQTLVISAYMILVASVSYSDVMHGILQKHWRMDIIGISYILHGIALIVTFVTLFHFFDLLIAVIGMSLFSVLIALTFDTSFTGKYTKIKPIFESRRIFKLLKTCFPLVIVSLLYILIPSYTRIILEKLTDTQMLGIYGSVTLPATIILAVALSAFAPFLNVFTTHYRDKDRKRFMQVFWIGIAGILLGFAVFFVLSILFGKWIISLLFGEGMTQYTYLFIEAIAISLFSCLFGYISMPLTVFRRTKAIMLLCSLGILVCILLLKPLVEQFGCSGANYVQIAAYGIIVAGMFFVNTIVSKKEFAPG